MHIFATLIFISILIMMNGTYITLPTHIIRLSKQLYTWSFIRFLVFLNKLASTINLSRSISIFILYFTEYVNFLVLFLSPFL